MMLSCMFVSSYLAIQSPVKSSPFVQALRVNTNRVCYSAFSCSVARTKLSPQGRCPSPRPDEGSVVSVSHNKSCSL